MFIFCVASLSTFESILQLYGLFCYNFSPWKEMLCTSTQWRAVAFLLFHLWCLWQVMAACWQWQSRWLLGHHCCWGGEWAFWKDGTRATGLKPGWLEMAGLCPNEGQSWGTWEEIKAWWGLQDRYGICGGKCEVFPSITSLTGCCHIPACPASAVSARTTVPMEGPRAVVSTVPAQTTSKHCRVLLPRLHWGKSVRRDIFG